MNEVKNMNNANPFGPLLLGMSAPALTAKMPPFIVDRGEAEYIFDKDGKKYLDCQAGLWCVNVGHGRKEINNAITAQLEKIACYNSFVDTSNQPSIDLGSKIIEMTQQENMAKVMFSSGGSDAVETALKLARQYWKLKGEAQRYKFISLQYGYHGVHFGGASVNGNAYYKEAYEPLLPGCFNVPSPFLYRNPWSDDPEELGEICAGFLEQEILNQGPNSVAAFIAEPIQGAGGGVIVPPANFWPRVRQICDKYGVLLIADEVITGFGRAGDMFGSRMMGAAPDIMCVAKGLSSGYIPLGATVINERVASAWDNGGMETAIWHGYTYMGHAVACAAGLVAIDIVEKEKLPENAKNVGAYFLERLLPLKDEFKQIGDIRGQGLMLAIEYCADHETRVPVDSDFGVASAVAHKTLQNGVVIRGIANKMIASPPLTLNKDQVDVAVDVLRESLKDVLG